MRDWLLPILAIAGVGLLVYARSFSAQFTEWDDWDNVAKNPAMLGGVGKLAEFWTDLAHPAGDMYIPVTHTVWYLLSQLAQLDTPDAAGIFISPIPFHFTNIFLHILNALLVYLLLARLVNKRWASAAGALVYLLHPLQVESAAWVTGLKDVLSGTFCLLALYGWIRFLQARPSTDAGSKPQERAPVLWYALAATAYLLAALSKPSAIVVPLLAMVLGAAWLCRAANNNPALEPKQSFLDHFVRAVLVPLIPLVLMTIPYIVEGQRAQPAMEIHSLPLWMRPAIAGDALAFYLQKLVAPISLGIDYGRRPELVMQQGWGRWTWMFPVALLAGASWHARRRPLLLAAVLMFFLAPLPVLGFLKFKFQVYSTVADRYLYLAMLGPALAMAVLMNRFAGKIAVGTGVSILAVLAALTFIQTQYWNDDLAVFEHAAAVNPLSITAHAHLGKIYAQRGRTDLAVREYELALRIRPEDGPTHYNLGNLLLRQQRFDEAVEQYRLALPLRPDDAPLRNNLGVALAQLGKLPEAADAFRQSLRIDPNYADAQNSLQRVLARLGNSATHPSHP